MESTSEQFFVEALAGLAPGLAERWQQAATEYHGLLERFDAHFDAAVPEQAQKSWPDPLSTWMGAADEVAAEAADAVVAQVHTPRDSLKATPPHQPEAMALAAAIRGPADNPPNYPPHLVELDEHQDATETPHEVWTATSPAVSAPPTALAPTKVTSPVLLQPTSLPVLQLLTDDEDIDSEDELMLSTNAEPGDGDGDGNGSPDPATVTKEDLAEETAKMLKIQNSKNSGRRRVSVSAEVFKGSQGGAASGDDSGPPLPARSREMLAHSRELIWKALDATAVLFDGLEDFEKGQIVDSMFDRDFESGDVIIRQGDEGDNFYVLDYGAVEFVIDNEVVGSTSTDGAAFGELALMYNDRRKATVRCIKPTLCWAMNRAAYQRIKMGAQESKRNAAKKFLEDFLKDLPDDSEVAELFPFDKPGELAQILDLCVRPENNVSFAPGTYIVREGDIGNDFFILKAGAAIVTKASAQGEKKVMEYGPGGFFGELALRQAGGRRSASVLASGATGADCLTINRTDFNRLIDAEDILARSAAKYEKINAAIAS